MNEIAIGLITFVFTFGSAWWGMIASSEVPPSHLSKESQDVVRLGMGLVATMTALLLGLVISAAKGSFDSLDQALRNSAVNILTLDRHLARYGPEAEPTRELLQHALAARIELMWPGEDAAQQPSLANETAASPAEEIQNRILALTPETDAQQWYKAEALKLTDEVVKTRWRMLGSSTKSVPRTFMVVVVFWLMATFASFGFFAPRNGTVFAVLLVASLSVAAAVFLILELDGPYTGLIRLPSEPLRYALAHIGQ